jgi:hypothetical protein
MTCTNGFSTQCAWNAPYASVQLRKAQPSDSDQPAMQFPPVREPKTSQDSDTPSSMKHGRRLSPSVLHRLDRFGLTHFDIFLLCDFLLRLRVL